MRWRLSAASGQPQTDTLTGKLIHSTCAFRRQLERAPGTAEAFQYTAVTSGSVNHVYVYLGRATTSAQVQVGLYADNAGDPGDVLAAATISTPRAGAWNRVDVPPVRINAGQRYWIAVLGPTGTGKIEILDAGESGARSVSSADTGLASLPGTWSSGATWSSSPVSAYAAEEP
jgi:hypothetical protein